MDNHKGIRVDFLNNGANLCCLGKLCYNKKHITLAMGKGTFAVQVGYTTTNNFDDCFGNGFRIVADDDNVLLKSKPITKALQVLVIMNMVSKV